MVLEERPPEVGQLRAATASVASSFSRCDFWGLQRSHLVLVPSKHSSARQLAWRDDAGIELSFQRAASVTHFHADGTFQPLSIPAHSGPSQLLDWALGQLAELRPGLTLAGARQMS